MSTSTPLRYAIIACTALLFFLITAPQASAQVTVRGEVIDAGTLRPVSAVLVTTGSDWTLTDQRGRFLIALSTGEGLEFSRLGYETVRIESPDEELTVRLVAAPVLLSGLSVQAEGPEVLASGTALTMQRSERDRIQASGGTNVAEALDRLEGVSMSWTGAWGSRPVVRGMVGERIAVMIDGNRVSRACTYGMDQGLATVDPATIERVEVLTGPGSALYGSGNLGGVINVVTRRASADGFGGEVRVRGSSGVPGGGLGVSLGGIVGDFRLDASVDGASYDDYRAPDGVVGGSSYRQLTGDLRADWNVADAHLLSLSGQYYAGRDIGWPMRGGAEIPEETRKSLAVDWGWQRGGAIDAVSARAYHQRLDHHMLMSMIMPGMNGMTMSSSTDAVSWSETSGLRGQVRVVPGAAVRVEAGLEATRLFAEGTRWTERRMGSSAPNEIVFRTWPGVEVLDLGAFAQARWEATGALALSTGVRIDRVSRDADVGADVTEWIPTGNVGLDLRLASGFGLRASLGRGYRTPDPLELYGLGLRPDGFVYRGSDQLETETSRNVEATLSWQREGAALSVTGFVNDLDDLVVPVLAGDSIAGRPVREYRNVRDARIRGASGTVEFALMAGLGVAANLTWNQGLNRDTDAALPMIPPLEGGVALRRDLEGPLEWVEVEWSGAARQHRVARDAGEMASPGWSVTHLRAALELAGSQVTLGVENVFDELYRAHLDPMTLHRPGRNLFVRVTRRF